MLYSTPFLNKPLWEEDEAIIFLMNIEIPMREAKSEIRLLDFQEKNCTEFNPEKLSRKMALENWLNKQTRLVDNIKNHLAADVGLGKLKQIILRDKPHYYREEFIDWVFDNQICQFIDNKESLRVFDEIRNETDNQAKATQQAEAVVNDGEDKHVVTELKEQKLSKLQKQQKAILEVIKNNSFNPMAIQDGKKTGVIQKDCENKYADIFNGSTSFDRAWDLGLKSNLWRMEYHDSYARRGNN